MGSNDKIMLDRIISDMSDGVLVLGEGGKCLLHNDSALSILGWNEEMLGGGIAQLLRGNDANDVFADAVIEAVYEKKKLVRTLPYFRGEDMLYLRVTTDLMSDNTAEAGIIVHVSDVTEATMLFIANKRLANQVLNLMHSFVKTMVTAIEEKSAYNANHTKNMAGYAEKYLDWLRDNGELSSHTSDNTDPLLMSIWLHDIGKLLVPAEIMDKPTRLGSELKDILHRIEVSKLVLRLRMAEKDDKSEYMQQTECLEKAKELILFANGAGFLDDVTIAELKRAAELDCFTSDGESVPLLNEHELKMITVQRGTLTSEERNTMESHVSLTKKLLSKMEFRGEYKKVPFWAGSHHELLDGSGYPDRLSDSEIPWETRLLTIIDIYDALTAEDRPYKPPMPCEKAFAILNDMAEHGKLDKTILSSFRESGAWNNSNSND